jgi:hypothetical protein
VALGFSSIAADDLIPDRLAHHAELGRPVNRHPNRTGVIHDLVVLDRPAVRLHRKAVADR